MRLWIALDAHKNSIVAATLPSAGAALEVQRIENTERAIRRLVDRLGGPDGLAVAYEAGPCGYDLLRLLGRLGVACDVIAPSLVPVRAGDRVKTDKRDAKKLVRLYRAGELSFVAAPSPEQEGLRDLVRCLDDLRCARTAARHRIAKQLLRHGHIFREGKKSWTKRHIAWVRRQRLTDPNSQRALVPGRSARASWARRPSSATSRRSRRSRHLNTKRGARGLILPAASLPGNPGENRLLPQTISELTGLGLCPREVALDGGFTLTATTEALEGLAPDASSSLGASSPVPDAPNGACSATAPAQKDASATSNAATGCAAAG